MIEIIIALLLSLGIIKDDYVDKVQIIEEDQGVYGVVNCDDVGSRHTVIYDAESATFIVK